MHAWQCHGHALLPFEFGTVYLVGRPGQDVLWPAPLALQVPFHQKHCGIGRAGAVTVHKRSAVVATVDLVSEREDRSARAGRLFSAPHAHA